MKRDAMKNIAARGCLVASLSAFCLQTQAQAPSPAAAAAPARAGEPITLNFVNADVEAVARALAPLAGRQVVVDPRVKGPINLSTDRPVPPQQAWMQFLAVLRLQGYAAVESAGLVKIVPEADAKLQGGAVNAGGVGNLGGGARAGTQIATQIFKLNHESAGNLVAVLRPLIGPNNTINVNPGNNSLVITDYVENLQRLARIIAALDVSNATDVEVIPLKHALAQDLVPLVQKLMDAGGSAGAGASAAAPGAQAQADTSYRTTLLAEPRSNAVVLRAANPARAQLVRQLVQKLDQPSAGTASGNIHVVYLKNADATKLAVTLRAALAAANASAGMASGATATGASASPVTAQAAAPGANAATQPIAASAQPSTGGQIQADPATNSLIITAPEPQYRQLRAVIDQLDARRAQVFVESLIAEVRADKAGEFGIQWQGPLGQKGDGTIGLLGTNFGTQGRNLVSLSAQGLTGSATLPSTGINFGLLQRVNGVYVLGALARALETNGDGNVLSTPTLLTLDNEEAKIVIGKNVPFVTGQYLSANTPVTSGTVSPFQTIERKDVGLTLRIKPQISENGTVKLAIFQEVSSVDPASVGASTGLVTNKRSIESNVLVDDGSVVVLGGLLSDEYSDTVDKVPGLGDVPVLGNLFKTESRTRSKTNLMVFLRPLVVRDAAAAETLSLDRYELMRSTQQMVQPVPNAVLGQDSGPQLAPAPVKAPAGTTPAAIVVPSIPVRPVPAWPPTGGSPAPVDPNASSAGVAP